MNKAIKQVYKLLYNTIAYNLRPIDLDDMEEIAEENNIESSVLVGYFDELGVVV